MFCDLVGSTVMSEALDPEDYLEILAAYRDALTEIVSSRGGYIARFLGDGLLAYFGYPSAAEDDVERAARAALDITATVPTLTDHEGEPLAARVGIATGLVVAGDIVGAGVAKEHAVSGKMPNLAARLQGQAAPNTILISPETRKLLGDQFEVRDLGEASLKGISRPVAVHELVGERAAESRFAARHESVLGATLGRDAELGRMSALLGEASAGRGQMMAICGDPGVGKSRLLHAFREQHLEAGYLVLQCSPQTSSTMLHPVLQYLAREAAFSPGDGEQTNRERLRALVDPDEVFENAMPLLYELLGVPLAENAARSAANERLLLLECLQSFITTGRVQTLVLLVEDVHWIDPTTEELLLRISRQLSGARLLAILTHRPEYALPWRSELAVTLELDALSERHARDLVATIDAGSELPEALVSTIVARCDGNPLFLEEVTKNALEVLAGHGGDVSDVDFDHLVPVTLQDSLMARLDRMEAAKPIAQLCAVVGRTFEPDLIAKVADRPAGTIADAFKRLEAAELMVSSGTADAAEYSFCHALIQDVAYESLLRQERKKLHLRVAKVLRESDLSRVEPERIALHLTQGDAKREALEFWERAGVMASERSANVEAIHHLNQALTILEAEGIAPDESHELDIRVRLAGAVRATKGYASEEAGAAGRRILALARRIERKDVELQALNGLYSYHLVRSAYVEAGVYADELLAAARRAGDATYEMIGHRAHGIVAFHVGQLADADVSIQEALDRYDVDRHAELANVYGSDHAETCAAYLCLARWVLGRPDDAIELQSWAIRHSERIEHAHSLAQALAYRAMLLCMNRDWSRVLEDCARAIPFAAERSLKLMEVFARATGAIAQANLTPDARHVHEMASRIEDLDRIAPNALQPYLLTELARMEVATHRLDDAEATLARAEAVSNNTGEVWARAETDRVLAGIHWVRGEKELAALDLRRALDTADAQDAHMWRLRAATDLALCSPDGSAVELLKGSITRVRSSPQHFDMKRANDAARRA